MKIPLKTRLYCWKEDFKAWRRGEVRVAEKGVTRGRIYEKRDLEAPVIPDKPVGGASMFANATADLEIQITRADGTVETYNEKAKLG